LGPEIVLDVVEAEDLFCEVGRLRAGQPLANSLRLAELTARERLFRARRPGLCCGCCGC